MPNYVPTPEEIATIVNRRVAGEADIKMVAEERSLFGNKVEELRKQVSILASKNKMTPQEAREALLTVFAAHNMSPAEELVEMVMERNGNNAYKLDPDLRAKILLELNQYVMPKLRSVEVSGTVNHAHSVVIVRFGEDGTIRRESIKTPVTARQVVDVVGTDVKEVLK